MTTTGFDPLANRLGALALRIADRMEVAVTDENARSLSSAAALSALERFFPDAPSIDELRRVLGLSHAGTVRLVDTLERAALVRRERGEDSRVRAVALTAKGRRVKNSITAARERVLVDALGVLDDDERDTLAMLVDKVLIGLVRALRPGPAMCRLCHTEVCGAERGRPCPVTEAALGLR